MKKENCQNQESKVILIFDPRQNGIIKQKEKIRNGIEEIVKSQKTEGGTIKITKIVTKYPLVIIFKLEGNDEKLRYIVPAIEETFKDEVSTRGVLPISGLKLI